MTIYRDTVVTNYIIHLYRHRQVLYENKKAVCSPTLNFLAIRSGFISVLRVIAPPAETSGREEDKDKQAINRQFKNKPESLRIYFWLSLSPCGSFEL